ncbi:shikimate 5-dehydrogenase [Candidatus Magnetoovum chiemensis]|nr:shikimate 5-dehydrogenase [Candidatus Magnetoovum chiemensis]
MINAKTKIAGLYGYPVEHSLSPNMHNAGFKDLGLNARYVAFTVRPEDIGNAVAAVKSLNMIGVNITVPHKEMVIPFLDKVNEEARFIGAVNAISNENGTLIGYNTDGRGFIRSLEEAAIDLSKKNVFMVGAGGAARAISYYICQKAARLDIFDIDTPKLNNLVNSLSAKYDNAHSQSDLSLISAADVVINATPLGLKDTDPLPLDVSLLKAEHTVCDLVYWQTKFLQEASRIGCKTINGLGMLFWQGVLSFELFTKTKAPVDVMKKALTESVSSAH